MESIGMATAAEGLGSNEALIEDHTQAEISTAIFRLNPSNYRLMTFVRTAPHLRVRDPAQALHGLSNTIFTKCPHTTGVKTHDSVAIQEELHVYRFDDILADWVRHTEGKISSRPPKCSLTTLSSMSPWAYQLPD
jgi:hypothetical protein